MQPLHPDHALAQAALRGEPAAVAWLETRLLAVPRLLRRSTSRFGPIAQHDVEDLAQQVVSIALRRLPDYHGLAPFEAWVHRIAVHTLFGWRRRQRRHGSAGFEVDPIDPGLDPTTWFADQERWRDVQAAIGRIGGVEAEVLRQVHFEGLDFATISRRTGIAMATLRTRYYRGLQRLREILRPRPGDQDA
jgi:RNA polymerase sigma-70 factor, ECF subfamily